MARPERHDVDYFPFFAKRGKTLNILQNKFGLEGIGFFTNLLRFLAMTPDHYYCISEEDDRINFFAEMGIREESKGMEIINTMVKTGKLDKNLWENYKVIASESFLESLKEAYKRRSNEVLTIDDITAKFENVYINTVNVDNNSVIADIKDTKTGLLSKNDDNNPQSKVKKSKVKKSKENSSDFAGSDDENKTHLSETSQSMKDAIVLSDLLLSSHRKEIPDYLSGKDDADTIQRWAVDIDKLIRLDKKSQDNIRQVILWAKTPGNFWFNNIQSGDKLRKHFERLFGEMITKGKRTGKNHQQHQIAADFISDDDIDQYFS